MELIAACSERGLRLRFSLTLTKSNLTRDTESDRDIHSPFLTNILLATATVPSTTLAASPLPVSAKPSDVHCRVCWPASAHAQLTPEPGLHA